MVVLVWKVDNRRATKTTNNTKTTTHTITPLVIQIDKFFLIITATLTTDITKLYFPIIYYHHNHHFNPINTTTAITQTTLNQSTYTTLKKPPLKNCHNHYHIQYCAIPYHRNHHHPHLETTKTTTCKPFTIVDGGCEAEMQKRTNVPIMFV